MKLSGSASQQLVEFQPMQILSSHLRRLNYNVGFGGDKTEEVWVSGTIAQDSQMSSKLFLVRGKSLFFSVSFLVILLFVCYNDSGSDCDMKKEMKLSSGYFFFLILGTLMQIWETYSKLNSPYSLLKVRLLYALSINGTTNFHYLQKPGQLPI